MPTTRSSASTGSATVSGRYNLRSNRPSAGFFAGMDDEPELTSADYAAAASLVALRSSVAPVASVAPAVTPQRRSARIASRS